jgi:hydrogenase maturation protein HypF
MAYLWQAGIEWDDRLMPIRACPVAEREVLLAQLEKGINVVPTSSMGRLFDVVSALAGVCQTVTYEAQAAIELEAKADLDASGSYQFDLRLPEIDIRPVLRAVVTDVLAGTEPAVVSARFHRAVAELVLQASQSLRATTGINRVALSGGVFQNVTLLELAARHLEEAGFDLLVHHKVPPNDGGLALGQAVIAAQSSAP